MLLNLKVLEVVEVMTVMMNPYDVDDDQHYELLWNILNFYLNFVFRPVMEWYKKSRTFKTHQLATNKLGEKNRWLKEAIFSKMEVGSIIA